MDGEALTFGGDLCFSGVPFDCSSSLIGDFTDSVLGGKGSGILSGLVGEEERGKDSGVCSREGWGVW